MLGSRQNSNYHCDRFSVLIPSDMDQNGIYEKFTERLLDNTLRGGHAPPQSGVWTESFRQISVMMYGIDGFREEVLEEHAMVEENRRAFSDGNPDNTKKIFLIN